MPQFDYSPYRSPFSGTLSQLLGQEGDIRAKQALAVGNAQAQGSQQSGAVWANTLNNIGQIAANVPQELNRQKLTDAQATHLGAETTALNAKAAEDAQKVADLKALDTALSTPGGRQAVIEATPGHLRPAVIKQYEDADKLAAAARETAKKAMTERQEYMGYLGAQIHQAGYDPATALATLHHARDQFADEPETVKQIDQMRLQFIEQPASIKQVADAAMLGSSYKSLLVPQRPIEHDPLKDLVSPTGEVIKAAVPKPTTPAAPGPIHDTAGGLARIGADNTATPIVDASGKPVQGYHPPAARSGSDVGGPGTQGGLTPDATEYVATQYRVLGAPGIPTRIGEAEKEKIINAAAVQVKALGQSPAVAVQKQAAFKADAASLTLIGRLSSSAEAFENKALQQADIVVGLSNKVDRTNSPILNAALLAGKKEIVGDTDTQLLYNALTTFTSEYAKIMEGSTGSVAASGEGARRAAERLVKPGLAPETLAKTIELMKKEMRFTIMGYDAVRDHITTKMGGTPGTTPAATAPAGPPRIYYDATGKVIPGPR